MTERNKQTLHIAWTVDDGPTKHTNDMVDVFKERGIPATWYIQRNNLTKPWLPIYQKLQNAHGHEVAIHGIHQKKDHLSWFPSSKLPSFESMDSALEDLGEFYNELKTAGLRVKFIRLPYGLFTEINQRLVMAGAKTGVADKARDIIKGQAGDTGPTQTVAKEFKSLQAEIKKLGLHLWGGASTDKVSVQSWEAESAGVGTGRTDNMPQIPKKMMEVSLPKRPSKTGSLVILCHDTSQADVKEVKRDIAEMEAVAKATNTTIKYHTMSSMYKQVVGREP